MHTVISLKEKEAWFGLGNAVSWDLERPSQILAASHWFGMGDAERHGNGDGRGGRRVGEGRAFEARRFGLSGGGFEIFLA